MASKMNHFVLIVCLFLQMARDVISFGFVCNLPMEPGPCKAHFPRYYFDAKTGRCRNFTYGGCHGNGNSFATDKDCEKACIAKDPSPTARQLHVCRLPLDAGPCLGNEPRFFYNATSGKCDKFVYGGCAGNDNRFKTAESCQMLCNGVGGSGGGEGSSGSSGSTTESSGSQHGHHWISGTKPVTPGKFLSNNKDCNQPRHEGMCLSHIPAFFYNTGTGECESFVYGGCQGNANRFQSILHCEQKCKATAGIAVSACVQPKRVGPCLSRVTRWFFDKASRSCKMFYYGGCGANGNNFASKMACEQQCVYNRQNGYNARYRSLLQYYLLHLWGFF